jgi:hypothetical protein
MGPLDLFDPTARPTVFAAVEYDAFVVFGQVIK